MDKLWAAHVAAEIISAGNLQLYVSIMGMWMLMNASRRAAGGSSPPPPSGVALQTDMSSSSSEWFYII